MATEKPNYNWTNKVDGQDDVLAEDVNTLATMAQSGIDLGYEANKRIDELPATPEIDESNLVHKSGDETISGVKTFDSQVNANGGVKADSFIGRTNGNVRLLLENGNGETQLIADNLQIDLGSGLIVNTETGITLNSPYQPISLNGKTIVLKDQNDEGINIDGNNNLTIDSGHVQINSWMDTHIDASGYIMLNSKSGGVNITVENSNNDIDLSSNRNLNLFAERKIDISSNGELDLYCPADLFLKSDGIVRLISNTPDGEPKATINDEDIATQPYVDEAVRAKANSADVYTKTEIDANFQITYNAMNQLNVILSAKANAVDVYTKEEVDLLVSSAIEDAFSKFLNVSEVGQ